MDIVAKIDNVFLVFVIICVALLVLITFLMVFFVIKYNKNRNKEKPKNIHGSALLEITWTVIPTLLVLGMFYYGWVSYTLVKNIPADAMEIAVTGRMWSWMFTYGNGVQSDTLFVPVGADIKLNLNSQDVIHSFFVPAFRIKQDVVPGMTNNLWFNAPETGTYDILCAEYCGLQHSYMLSSLVVLPKEEYKNWLDTQASEQQIAESDTTGGKQPAETNLVAMGKQVFTRQGCAACHTTDGNPSVGPTFQGIFSHKVTVVTNGQDRQLTVDEDYIRRSVENPKADITKGFQPLMPPQELTEEQMEAIIAFIKQLSETEN